MGWIKYVLILWLVVYFYGIIKLFIEILTTKRLLDALKEFADSASIEKTEYGHINLQKKSKFEANRDTVILLVPSINRHLGTWDGCNMDYGKTDKENYLAAMSTGKDLLMAQTYNFDKFWQSLNPINGIKALFQLPSIFFKWLGINFKDATSKVWNIISWIVVYLLYAYQSEIKSLLNSFFH